MEDQDFLLVIVFIIMICMLFKPYSGKNGIYRRENMPAIGGDTELLRQLAGIRA